MRFPLRKNRALILVGVASLIPMVGCERQSTPPGPSSSFGIIQPDTHFEFLSWDEGLAILLIDNITKGHNSSGSGSTKDPVYRLKGSAVSEEGHSYSWTVETTDGLSGKVVIEGNEYDLSKGAVFSIKVTENGTMVDQLDLDLSQLSGVEQCRAFVKANGEALGLKDSISEKR